MHPAFNNCLLTFFGQPPVNQSLCTLRILGFLENSDWGRNVDYAVGRVNNLQRLFLGVSQLQDVFFQNHYSCIFTGQQLVLNSGVTFFNAQAVSFQFIEIFPTVFVSQSANCYISSTGQHRVRHCDFAFPFRIGQISPVFRSFFRFQLIGVISNNHIGDTNAIPVTIFVFFTDNVSIFFGFIR